MKAIITALHAAYQECGYVQKTGKAPQYKFASEAAFIEALRPILIKHGIVVFPSGCTIRDTGSYATKNGGVMNRLVGEYSYTFAHVGGESIVVQVAGEGADNGDKAAYKANTGALKYALRQTLLIETGDDPDQVTPEPRAAEPTAAQREAAANAFITSLDQWLSIHDPAEHADHVRANLAKVQNCMKYENLKSRAADLLALVE